MANLALLRKSNLRVVGSGSRVEVIQVTGHASRTGQVVVVIDVALRTRHGGMEPGQRESG